MAFDNETIDVLIGGYLSTDAAHEDYEAALASGGYLHGAVVVSKDLKGNLAVEQTQRYLTTGSSGAPEKQSIDCELVTRANVDQFGVFARK